MNRYRAVIRVDGELHHLGRFKDVLEAARVYDEAARRFFGEFAFQNFPKEDDPS